MVFGLFLEPLKSYLLLFGIIFTGFLLEIDTNYLAKEMRAWFRTRKYLTGF
jgi:hypothetical protein